MGTLRYAVLGLLNRRSMTGYELAQEFNSALKEFWSARHSQIYPELKKLSEEGLVTFETEAGGPVLEKKRYTITAEGRHAFMAWEKKPRPLKPTPKDEFRLQLFFSDCLRPGERETLLRAQLDGHHGRLEHLEGNAKTYGDDPCALESSAFSDYLVLLGAIEREKATCRWLETCLALETQRGEAR